MWNRRNLPPPPSCDRKVLLTHSSLGVLSAARQSLSGASQLLTDYTGTLRTEQFVLTRYIYKFSNQFRSEKSLKALRQVKSCMTRLPEIDLHSLMSDLHSFVDVCEPENTEVYLPSRQMLEHKLVRLISIAALLTQTASYSQHAFMCARQHMASGMFIAQNVGILALSARLWYVTRSLANRVVKWYHAMLPCLNVLQPTLAAWLPEAESLPKDLPVWLEEQLGHKRDEAVERSILQTARKDVQVTANSGSTGKLATFEDLGEIVVRREEIKTTADETVDMTRDKETLEIDREFHQHLSKVKKVKRTGNKRKLPESVDAENDFTVARKKSKLKKCKIKEEQASNLDEKSGNMKLKKGQVGKELTRQVNKECNDMSSGNTDKNMGSLLKQTIKSFRDVESFQNQVKTRKVEVGGTLIVLSKEGKRNILKVLKTVRHMASASGPDKMQEKKLLKWLVPALEGMLVGYVKKVNNSATGAADIGEKALEGNVKKVKDNTSGDADIEEKGAESEMINVQGQTSSPVMTSTVCDEDDPSSLGQLHHDNQDVTMLRKPTKKKKKQKKPQKDHMPAVKSKKYQNKYKTKISTKADHWNHTRGKGNKKTKKLKT